MILHNVGAVCFLIKTFKLKRSQRRGEHAASGANQHSSACEFVKNLEEEMEDVRVSRLMVCAQWAHRSWSQ